MEGRERVWEKERDWGEGKKGDRDRDRDRWESAARMTHSHLADSCRLLSDGVDIVQQHLHLRVHFTPVIIAGTARSLRILSLD